MRERSGGPGPAAQVKRRQDRKENGRLKPAGLRHIPNKTVESWYPLPQAQHRGHHLPTASREKLLTLRGFNPNPRGNPRTLSSDVTIYKKGTQAGSLILFVCPCSPLKLLIRVSLVQVQSGEPDLIYKNRFQILWERFLYILSSLSNYSMISRLSVCVPA